MAVDSIVPLVLVGFPLLLLLVVLARRARPVYPLDEAAGRRLAGKVLDKPKIFYDARNVKVTDGYVTNSRGVKLFTRRWLPKLSGVKGLVFFCHGYGDTCAYLFEESAIALAQSGYAVLGMDYEGFGRSDGLHGHIKAFDTIIEDVIEYTQKVKEEPMFRGKASFLFGESMGGAVAIKAHFKDPSWDGAVLVAPMCKIADEMIPPWYVVKVLKVLSRLLPTARLVPTRDLCDATMRDPRKRKLGHENPLSYKGKPRLQTAYELLATTDEIEMRLEEVSFPFLVLHGEDDIVTDPSVSRALYEQASSDDKSISLYPGSWHGLLTGEPDDVIKRVLDDIVSWLDQRTMNPTTSQSTTTRGDGEVLDDAATSSMAQKIVGLRQR